MSFAGLFVHYLNCIALKEAPVTPKSALLSHDTYSEMVIIASKLLLLATNRVASVAIIRNFNCEMCHLL